MLNKLITNNPIIQKLKSFGKKPEIKEAERFEDWYNREVLPIKASVTLETSQKVSLSFPIDESIEPIDYSKMADDIPSQEDWYRFRVCHDEINGLSYTG